MPFGLALRRRALVLFAFFLPLSSFAEIRLVCESSGADEYYNLKRTVVLTGSDQLRKERSGHIISETWSEEEVHFTSTKKLASGTGYDEFFAINRTSLSGVYISGPSEPGAPQDAYLMIQCRKAERKI